MTNLVKNSKCQQKKNSILEGLEPPIFGFEVQRGSHFATEPILSDDFRVAKNFYNLKLELLGAEEFLRVYS